MEDRLSPGGEDEPEYPKPRTSSQVVPSFLLPIEWGEKTVSRMRTRYHGGTRDQVWLPARDGDGRSRWLQKALCLIPEESAWQRLWEGLENKTDSGQHRMKLKGTTMLASHTKWIHHGWVWLQGSTGLGGSLHYF